VKKPPNTRPPASASRNEWIAGAIVLVLGAPLIFGYAHALADGETRRKEAPLRAVLGDKAFERLSRGEKTEEHYFGNSLLAPDFTLPDQNGKPWSLRDRRGKLVVINFWTLTCQPCVEELPSLLELAQIAARRDDIEVVALSTDKNWDEVSTLFPPGNRLRVLFDPERKIVRDKFGTKLFPETWVIDARGVVRMRIDGRRDWSNPLTIDAIESFL
jgi:peroxiredoxin